MYVGYGDFAGRDAMEDEEGGKEKEGDEEEKESASYCTLGEHVVGTGYPKCMLAEAGAPERFQSIASHGRRIAAKLDSLGNRI